MRGRGRRAHRLTNDLKGILGLAWTADGREIVFASNRSGRFQLWRVEARPMDSAGAYANPGLVEGAGDDARNPSISRTSRLAYQQFSRNFDIQRVEMLVQEGTAKHRLGPSVPLITSTQLDATPSWSPDGKTIAFMSNRSGTQELWVCDADGSNPLKLTSFDGPNVIYPRWSPDGQRLVFGALTGQGGNFESYIDRQQRVGRPADHRGRPSHNGTPSVLSRWPLDLLYSGRAGRSGGGIPDAGRRGRSLQITQQGAFRPEESPDGKLLYYGKHGKHGLWSISVSGGEERQVLDSITE